MAKKVATKEKSKAEQLTAVAIELQELCEFEPPIKTKGKSEKELEKIVTEAASVLGPDDELSEVTRKTLAAFEIPIGGGEEAEEEEEEEEEAEEAEEEEAEEEEAEEEEEEEEEEEKPVAKKAAKKAAPAKKAAAPSGSAKMKLSTQEKVDFFSPLIQSGEFTTKDLVEKSLEKFPGLSESSVRTFLVDSKNPKYNKFPKLVVADEEGKLTFKKK